MKNVYLTFFAVVSFCLAGPFVRAGDYFLAEGETDTISTNAVYETMTVAGDLDVYVPGGTSSASKRVNFTSTLNLLGARLTLDSNGGSKYFRMGYGGFNDDPKVVVNLTNNTAGAYAQIVVRDMNAATDLGLLCEKLYLRKEAEGTAPENGILDFATLEGGSLSVRQLYNYSTCTGRVTLVGNGTPRGRKSYFGRRGRSLENNFVEKGPICVRLQDCAFWEFGYYNSRGDVNKAGEVLLSEGEGDVRILSRLYETEFRQGVSLNHQGSVQLYCDAAKSCGYFTFGDSDNLGPNVTNLTTAGYSANTSSNRVRIASGVVLTVQNVSICQEGAKSYLTGPGRLRVDATTGARTAKMTIRAGDDLVVEKVGGYELVVSQTTNISHLVVQEGVVRFTENCVVEDLQMAAGAKIVADGCCVTLKNAELLNVSAETVNGGEIAVARTGRTVAYDSSISGNLSFAGGTTVFSRHGIDKKYWRWTVTDVGSSPYPLRLRALYLFHGESWQNMGLDFVDAVNTEENLSALGEKKFRVICHPSTNLAVAAAADRESYQALQYIKTWFTVANGGNNYPKFVSPRINPADETSHVKIVMRLDDAALPITGYNLRTVHATGAGTPTAWRVEASDDGAAWTLVDTRQDAATPGKAYYTYDGVSYIKGTFNAQELFRFAGYRTDGLTPGGAPLQLTLSAGAVVDLRAFTGGQEVDAVTVDADALAGGGEIFGAKLAEKGVLTVKNLSALPASGLLPLRLPDVVEGGSLVKWTVRDETRERPYKAVVLEDGTVRLLAMGTCILLQ